jgi:hypothetical protein
MSPRLLSGCVVVALAACGATAASADDSGAATPSSLIAGYVEGHGAWESGSSTHYDPSADGTGTWADTQIGGSARGAVSFGTNWSLQGDLWAGSVLGSNAVEGGATGHVTWHSPGDAALLGVFGSLGQGGWEAGQVGTAGVEAVLNGARWRLYGQAGIVGGLSGDASDHGERDAYTTLSADYFFNPNFFVSGNIGADKWTENTGDASPEISWGARIEFKPDVSPVSFFAAYEGYGFKSTYHDTPAYDQGVDNVFFAGLRIPLGVGTLQQMQHAVGLADLNPMYGDPINR